MKKKKLEVTYEDMNVEPLVEESSKVVPLTLNLSGQLGQENLALVVAKLNEVIASL